MAKVMLVEDDNNLREIYEARLLAEGYEIVSARDGEEALALAVKERPDLIIADVMMPKISGFDMLDILRNTPETKKTKVIIMTALSQAEDKARADQLGADRYLVKSQVTLEDVAKASREVLQEQTGLPPAAEQVTQEPLAPVPIETPEPAQTITTVTTPMEAPTETNYIPNQSTESDVILPEITAPSNDEATKVIEPIISQPIVPAEPVSVPAMAPEPDTSAPVLPMAPEPSTTMPTAPEPVAATMPAMTMPEVTPVPAPTEPTATFDPITPPTTPDATTPPAPTKTDLLTDPNLIAL